MLIKDHNDITLEETPIDLIKDNFQNSIRN